jgi:hypothetical protein
MAEGGGFAKCVKSRPKPILPLIRECTFLRLSQPTSAESVEIGDEPQDPPVSTAAIVDCEVSIWSLLNQSRSTSTAAVRGQKTPTW